MLPPSLDLNFATEEGAWPAYNKAMHAAFGDKAHGIEIKERGPALLHTIVVTKWCLEELDKQGRKNEVELVALWIDALQLASRKAGATGLSHFYIR
jgi:hypothetical protein